jgi:hypothetical protein
MDELLSAGGQSWTHEYAIGAVEAAFGKPT